MTPRPSPHRKRSPRPADTGPHPAMLPEAALLKSCQIQFGRDSGPGGQHRNKVSTAALILHTPTQIVGRASERRHQSQNRHVAIRRLRLRLAQEIRRNVDPIRYRPTELWTTRRQGKQMSVNPKHADYPALLAEALDLIVARRFDIAGAAGVLGVTMSQLAKLIRNDGKSFALVNHGREERGMPKLK